MCLSDSTHVDRFTPDRRHLKELSRNAHCNTSVLLAADFATMDGQLYTMTIWQADDGSHREIGSGQSLGGVLARVTMMGGVPISGWMMSEVLAAET
jgi:hypothetical protein